MADFDPTDNRAIGARRDEQERIAKQARSEARQDFRWLMRQKRGRRILRRWIAESAPHHPVFAEGRREVDAARIDGMQDFGRRRTLEAIALCPSEYLLMLQEQNDGTGNTDD
ncbi:MAG: hypothetical protein LBE50_03490 [Gallionellaceae bacterium]|jgi:hypothetical protein|nr:hypothetical protein [Gallionellaceae bacterium]